MSPKRFDGICLVLFVGSLLLVKGNISCKTDSNNAMKKGNEEE